jgi:hypothetical protein
MFPEESQDQVNINQQKLTDPIVVDTCPLANVPLPLLPE